MKLTAYLLIFHILSAPIGDWAAVAPVQEAQPIRNAQNDGDVDHQPNQQGQDRVRASQWKKVEYPLPQRGQERLRGSLRKKPAFVTFRAFNGDWFSLVTQRKTAPRTCWITTFYPADLYVFMSLQC